MIFDDLIISTIQSYKQSRLLIEYKLIDYWRCLPPKVSRLTNLDTGKTEREFLYWVVPMHTVDTYYLAVLFILNWEFHSLLLLRKIHHFIIIIKITTYKLYDLKPALPTWNCIEYLSFCNIVSSRDCFSYINHFLNCIRPL